MWQRTSILHSGISLVDLYAFDYGGFVEIAVVYATSTKLSVCPIVDRLRGTIRDIVFDQNKTAVEWTDADIPKACSIPRLDMRLNRKLSGHYDTLDFLKYHLANAMNESFENRRFATFLKNELVGAWTCGGGQISFAREGTFQTTGSSMGTLKATPSNGRWSVGRNMLHLMDGTGLHGIRTQVIDARDGCLFLPGENGALHTIYKRAEPVGMRRRR